MQPLTFITFSRKAEAAKEIGDALAFSARCRLLVDCTDPDQFVADVLRLRPSAAIVVLEGQNEVREFGLVKQLAATCPETAVITAAYDSSPFVILNSIRSGVREFLQLPINTEEFKTVLARTEEFNATVVAKKSGRVTAVFSGKGGSGVSFFATNLAVAMSVPTVLVDLNLQTGDAASFLAQDPKYSLCDLVRNRARLDDSLIKSLVTQHSLGLSLVAAPAEAHEAEDVKPEDVTEILHLLAQRFQSLILDLPHTFDPVTVAALDRADDILMLMTLDVPGIRNTKRALAVFERLGYPRTKFRVVINRWAKNSDVELKKVEAHLNEQLIGHVPNDYGKVMNSINLGSPLVQSDPTSKIAVEIKRIAALLENNWSMTPPQPKKGLLGAVFGRNTGRLDRNTGTLELPTVSDLP